MATSLAESWAVNCPLVSVVAFVLPLNTIWLVPAKPLPLAVNVIPTFARVTIGLNDDRVGVGTVTVTAAVPDAEASAWLLATIVTELGNGWALGAVYRPELEMLPTVEFPIPAP